MRIYKYPLAQRIGKNSPHYAMALALEQWAVAHGYKGYVPHKKRTKKEIEMQQKIEGI